MHRRQLRAPSTAIARHEPAAACGIWARVASSVQPDVDGDISSSFCVSILTGLPMHVVLWPRFAFGLDMDNATAQAPASADVERLNYWCDQNDWIVLIDLCLVFCVVYACACFLLRASFRVLVKNVFHTFLATEFEPKWSTRTHFQRTHEPQRFTRNRAQTQHRNKTRSRFSPFTQRYLQHNAGQLSGDLLASSARSKC